MVSHRRRRLFSMKPTALIPSSQSAGLKRGSVERILFWRGTCCIQNRSRKAYHSVIPAFVGQIKCDVVELRQKCSNNDAYIVFDKMSKPSSECVLIAEAVDVIVMEGSHTQESFDQLVAVVNLSFDPGGEEHDKICDEFMPWSEHLRNFKIVHKGTVRSNACNVFDEMLDPTNKALTEVADLLLQSESYTPVVFDPDGSFILFKCHIIQRKI